MKDYTVEEIKSIGKNIQTEISESMSRVIDGTKCLRIGKSGDGLADLLVTSKKYTKDINALGNNHFTKLFMSHKRWLSKFNTIEGAIDGISDNVNVEIERLESILNGVTDAVYVMRTNLDNLHTEEEKLKGIVTYYEQNPDLDEYGLKSQAAISRLKILTTTSALTSQEISKSMLNIKENQEITNQLREASENLVPMIKTMMINVIAAKANEDAVNLRKNLVKTANSIVIESAKSISTTADNLIKGRTEALIAPETLEEANKIIKYTVERVVQSASVENQTNLKIIDSLEKSTLQIRELQKLEVHNE